MASFVYYEPRSTPLNSNGQPMPGATLQFYYTGTLNPAPIYADSLLTQIFPPLDIVSDGMGRFPVIYLDATISYRRQLYDQFEQLQSDVDPINQANPGITYGAIKQLTTTQTSNITLLVDPELSLLLPAGLYAFNATIKYQSGGGGLTFRLNTKTSIGTGSFMIASGSSTLSAGQILTLNLSSVGGAAMNWDAGGGGGTALIGVNGSFTIPQPEIVGIYWAQSASNSSGTSLVPSSTLTIQEITL